MPQKPENLHVHNYTMIFRMKTPEKFMPVWFFSTSIPAGNTQIHNAHQFIILLVQGDFYSSNHLIWLED
jgi:hypothetical protein